MKKLCSCAALLACLTFGAWTMAGAATSYNGSDYSRDYNSRHYLKTCDEEGDGTPVKGDYDFNNSGSINGTVKDSDGANQSCGSKNTGGTIAGHKTCEYRSFWPDACGSFVAP